MASLTYYSFFGQDFVQETYCNSGSFLSCKDLQLDTQRLKLKLKNNMEDTITNIRIDSNDRSLLTCDLEKEGVIVSDIARGESATLDCCVAPAYEIGDSEEITFNIYFQRPGGNEHYVNGVLRTTVREDATC